MRVVNSLREHGGFVCIETMKSLLCCWYIKGPRNFAFETIEDKEGMLAEMEEKGHKVNGSLKVLRPCPKD